MGNKIIPSDRNYLPQDNKPQSKIFQITDMQSYTQNLKTLARENADWSLSSHQIIAAAKQNRPIYRINFINTPITFSSNDGITQVLVAGKTVGLLDFDSTQKFQKIISTFDILSIRCSIQGGMYKVIDQNGNEEIQQKGLAAAIKITYQQKNVSDATTVSPAKADTNTSTSPYSQRSASRKAQKKAKKSPFYKRWWVWVLAIVLLLGSCDGKTDSAGVPETTAPTFAQSEPTETTLLETTHRTTAPTEDTLPTTEPETTEAPTNAPTPTEKKQDMVWISSTGKKYHRKSSCSNMKSPTQITKDEAIRRGYSACGRCY